MIKIISFLGIVMIVYLPMPGMNGLTATKTIRIFKQGVKITIIAITAHGSRFYEKAIEAGCNDLIEKPVDFDSLEIVLKQYLELLTTYC